MSNSSRSRESRCPTANSPKTTLLSGLPANVDTEQAVLGSVLLDDGRWPTVAPLKPDDFSIERHRRIFRCMQELKERGRSIDRVTVAEELQRRQELESDGVSYLACLDDGLPQLPHLETYVDSILQISRARQAIHALHEATGALMLGHADASSIVESTIASLQRLYASTGASGDRIRRIEDLASIFSSRRPTEYVVKPELPVKGLVALVGPPESGKTTVACGLARTAIQKGHPVLILDRDKNPRERICDRLERLGIVSDGDFLRVWDCEQVDDVPQPDAPLVLDWIRRRFAETGKSPVVIVDCLVSFLGENEDENSASHMRALFNRCRTAAKAGATGIVNHHTNRNGEARGSSDFRAACEQVFLVSNHDRAGGRLLDVITLECQKSRYGFSGTITYHYDGGRMARVDTADEQANQASSSPGGLEQLRALLKSNPGIQKEAFVELATRCKIGRNQARQFLVAGRAAGEIDIRREGRRQIHVWIGGPVIK